MDEELDRFKRINLCNYAFSRGYRLVRRESTRGGGSRGSTASSLLLPHAETNDKIVARIDRDGHWTYFSVRDERDNGTIVDFALARGAPTIAAVRKGCVNGRGISLRPERRSRLRYLRRRVELL